jgi:hypothetical protein
MHEGPWTILASPDDIRRDGEETVDIMILGDTRLKLETKFGLGKNKQQLLIAARLLQDDRLLRKYEEVHMEAHILLPRTNTDDSEKQDEYKKENGPNSVAPSRRKSRLKTMRLYDNGKNGDYKAGDGIYTAAIDVYDLPPGLLQARLVAILKDGKLNLTREATNSFYVMP